MCAVKQGSTARDWPLLRYHPIVPLWYQVKISFYTDCIKMVQRWVRASSLLPGHSTAKLVHGTEGKIRFVPFHLPKGLLHWIANTTQKFHSQHGLASKGCLAGLAWRLGSDRPLPCHYTWLTAPHPFAKSPQHTQDYALLRTESCAGKHLSIQQWFSKDEGIFRQLYSWKSYEWH